MISLKMVKSDDVYESIHEYVTKKELIVDSYDIMIETILAMIKDGYCFVMDRDILRDAMESLTYMYAPSDDMNKDRLIQQFVDDLEEDSDEESVEEDNDGFGNMDLMKMMQMMGGMSGGPPQESTDDVEETCENSDECKNVVTDEEPVTSETTVVKEGEAVSSEPVA